jgi:putative transposase
MKKLDISLRRKDNAYLTNFLKNGQHHAREIVRAKLLLAVDRGVDDTTIAKVLDVDRTTIWRTRSAYQHGGLQDALYDGPRSGRPVKYSTREQSEIVALACSNPPEGRERWTLLLLTKEARSRKGLENLNRESVRLILKKTNVSLGSRECGA